jgi:hypothetical protein
MTTSSKFDPNETLRRMGANGMPSQPNSALTNAMEEATTVGGSITSPIKTLPGGGFAFASRRPTAMSPATIMGVAGSPFLQAGEIMKLTGADKPLPSITPAQAMGVTGSPSEQARKAMGVTGADTPLPMPASLPSITPAQAMGTSNDPNAALSLQDITQATNRLALDPTDYVRAITGTQQEAPTLQRPVPSAKTAMGMSTPSQDPNGTAGAFGSVGTDNRVPPAVLKLNTPPPIQITPPAAAIVPTALKQNPSERGVTGMPVWRENLLIGRAEGSRDTAALREADKIKKARGEVISQQTAANQQAAAQAVELQKAQIAAQGAQNVADFNAQGEIGKAGQISAGEIAKNQATIEANKPQVINTPNGGSAVVAGRSVMPVNAPKQVAPPKSAETMNETELLAAYKRTFPAPNQILDEQQQQMMQELQNHYVEVMKKRGILPTGGTTSPTTSTPSTPSTLQRGMVRNGYTYLGGDPAQQTSWRKV